MKRGKRKTRQIVGGDRDPSVPVVRRRPERTLLVGVRWSGMTESLVDEYLEELDMLARTAGAIVVGREMAHRHRPDAATLVGRGKVAELAEVAAECRVELLIFDDDLSPAQARNLEEGIGRRVIDRTGLILDIFARRARTRQAKTQVELAQLRYLLPRLTGAWTHLERQQGGIGLRGPGETQIETDRRIVRARIKALSGELKHIERVHHTQRAGREGMYRFALAGYTNVGKSTLMNALTSAGVYEEDLLFATLDSTTRVLSLTSQSRALLTDTVGFIRKLPPALVASFHTTLAEITEAHCILHIVDLASPSWRDQKIEVEKILAEMDLSGRPTILVFNKVDALDVEGPLLWATRECPNGVFVSARRGTGLEELLRRMRDHAAQSMVELFVEIGLSDGHLLGDLYRLAEVLEETQSESGLRLRVRLPREVAGRMGLMPSHSDSPP